MWKPFIHGMTIPFYWETMELDHGTMGQHGVAFRAAPRFTSLGVTSRFIKHGVSIQACDYPKMDCSG
jgi:hypothetical protein